MYILGILVDQRDAQAPTVQEVLTRYGSAILSRSGIPAPTRSRGIITITLQADPEVSHQLEQELTAIGGVQARTMNLGNPRPEHLRVR